MPHLELAPNTRPDQGDVLQVDDAQREGEDRRCEDEGDEGAPDRGLAEVPGRHASADVIRVMNVVPRHISIFAPPFALGIPAGCSR